MNLLYILDSNVPMQPLETWLLYVFNILILAS